MTGFAATHTGSLTPSSDPWTFVGTVTWQSDIDPAIPSWLSDSDAAATPGVVNPANDDLATGDLLRVDVDTAGTGAKGLVVSIEFEKAAI